MNHAQGRCDVPRALFVRSDLKGATRLAAHLVVLGLGQVGLNWTGVSYSDPAYWIFIWAVGIPGVFLFAPLHECIHRTAFAQLWINRALSHICGFMLLLPAGYFRVFHLEHHRYTQDPARDPELTASPPGSLRAYLWRLSGVPYWTERVTTTVRHASGFVPEPYVGESARIAIVKEARLYLTAYMTIAAVGLLAGSDAVVRCWIVPAVAAQPFLRAFLMAEHGAMPFTAEMLLNSRSTRSNRWVHLLAWNMPYHAEHHYQAAVPFHALPKLRQQLGERAPERGAGYLQFHREWLAGRSQSGAARRADKRRSKPDTTPVR